MINAEFINEASHCVKKWGDAGMLEGIKGEHDRRVTALLLENQYLANLKENAGTMTDDIAQFKRITLPLVRRVFPQLIANKLVGVQPLLGPTGLIYYLRFRYSTNKGSMRGADLTGGWPTDEPNTLGQRDNGDVNLKVHYSSTFVENEPSETDAGGDTTSNFTLEHTPITAGSVVGTVYDGDTAVATFAVSEAGTFSFTDIGTPSPKPNAGTLDLTTGAMTLTWTADPGANHVVVSYDYKAECNPDIPEINLTIENETVTAKRRMLKAVWSWDAEQDIRSQHGLDTQKELTNNLATEINLEIDREIVDDLRTNAGTTATWDYRAALGLNIKERYESLFVKVTEVSNIIHRKTLRGMANFIVTSPEVASVFETAIAGFTYEASEDFNTSAGIQYVGQANRRWRIYKDPNFPKNQILLGLKGDNYTDTGFFYCPYVPLTATPVVYHPDSFCPRIGMMTRYGKVMLRTGAKFYAVVNIANLNI